MAKRWPSDQLVTLGSRELDIRKLDDVKVMVDQEEPSWIILSAAYADVDGCEVNPQAAYEVNVNGAVNVAHAARESDVRLLLIGTDYVFDGSKTSPYEVNDAKNPLNVYGRTKSEGEDRLLQILPSACVLRTSRLFGMEGRCFPAAILAGAASNNELSVVSDQRGSPTYTRDLTVAIRRLIEVDAMGIHHAVNTGDCSWYEFAKEILREASLQTEVKPIASEQSDRIARRPRYSVLSNSSLGKHQIAMRPWQDALKEFMNEYKARTLAASSAM